MKQRNVKLTNNVILQKLINVKREPEINLKPAEGPFKYGMNFMARGFPRGVKFTHCVKEHIVSRHTLSIKRELHAS